MAVSLGFDGCIPSVFTVLKRLHSILYLGGRYFTDLKGLKRISTLPVNIVKVKQYDRIQGFCAGFLEVIHQATTLDYGLFAFAFLCFRNAHLSHVIKMSVPYV